MTSFDWTLAQAFLATVDHGSYSQAARALGVAQSTVGRHVAALEAELGVALVERVGNQMVPTETGLSVVDHVRAMEAAAQRVRLTADGSASGLEGVVRITASEAMSAFRLPSVVEGLRAQHPRIRVHLVTSNAIRDLLRREADIAIRNVRPDHAELVAKRLPDGQARFYATPAYLDRRGHPRTLEELATHDLISFAEVEAYAAGMRQHGVPVQADEFALVSSSHLVQWALCTAGLGVAGMDEVVGDADPRVERVLPDADPWVVPLWLVCHRELRTSQRIRTVFDALADALGK